MAAAKKALVIGGGFSGMSAAILLRRQGVEVDLVEIDPGWRNYGAGITIGGATLRALGTVGVLDEVVRQGFCADGCEILAPHGLKLAEIPTPRIAGPDVPGSGAIMRPVLARILADATRAAGVQVKLGCSFASIAQDAGGVDVAFTDGGAGRYDVVVGADGLFSKTRGHVLPQSPEPVYSGQGVWRAIAPRPPEVARTMMFMGQRVKAGLNPVSKEAMYLFVTEDRPRNERVPDEELLPQLKALLAEFPAKPIADVRAGLGPDSSIVFRPLEVLLVPQPWSRGRVVLIGDAVHATTPHLASGAGIGIEDAVVLAEELGRAADVAAALQAFQSRRWERCRMVVENSRRLGEIEMTGGSKEEHGRIMRESLMALAGPI